MPATRFLWHTLLLSLLGLIPVLLFYVALTPGFGSMLLDGGLPLRRFLRQVVTNGLPVVFAVNYISFFLFAWAAARSPSHRELVVVLLADIPGRLVVFVGLHAIIYVVSADWFGSFGGSRTTALRVVAPTLARSALFENISGVYLYATLVSALPLYVTVIERSAWIGGLAGKYPRRIAAFLLAILCFAFFVVALTELAVVTMRLQGA